MLVAIGVRWNQWLAASQPGLPFVKSLPAMLPYFAAGMLAAVLAHGRRISRRAALVLCGCGLALVAGDAVWQASIAAAKERSELALVIRDGIAAIGFAALVAVVGTRERSHRGLLASRPLAYAGAISYGVYLWHVPILLWLRAKGLLPLDPLGATLVAGSISALVASASWRWIEQPAIAWARERGGGRVVPPNERSAVSASNARAARRPVVAGERPA